MDDQLGTEMHKLRVDIQWLRQRLQHLEARLDRLAAMAKAAPPPEAATKPVAPLEPPPPGAATKPVAPLEPPPLPSRAPARAPQAAPAAPRAEVTAPPEKAEPKHPTLSLEQRIGASWLIKVGVVVLILTGVFFFQYAIEEGWISKPVRVICGVAAGLAMLGLGEWALRKRMRIFAGAVAGGGIALLYLSVYAASPRFYDLLSMQVSFALMCAVTAIGVALSLRSGILPTAVLAQIGAYLTPWLLGTGKDEQVVLMTYLLAVNAGFLVVAAIKRWEVLAGISGASTAMLFARWYLKFYDPAEWLRTDAFAWGLLALLVGYAAVSTSLRRARRATGIGLTLFAAASMLLLWSAQREDLTVTQLLGQVVALNACVLALAALKRWSVLALPICCCTAALFAGWMVTAYSASLWAPTVAFGWALVGLYVLYAAGATAGGRCDQLTGIGLVSIAGGLMAALLLAMSADMADTATLGHLLALDAVVLAACLWRRWHWLRAGALAWTAAVMALTFDTEKVFGSSGGPAFWSTWIWAFFALFTADVLLRAWWRTRRTLERLDAGLATVALGAMFGATYFLLRNRYADWMGLYTALLAVAGFGLAWLTHRLGRRLFAHSYLGNGLVLVTLAMPIQFDKASVTIAWAAESVVAMLLVRRLNPKLMLVTSWVVLLLAICHFHAIDLPSDPRMGQTMLSVGGVDIRYALVLAAGLTAAAFMSMTILRAGKPLFDDVAETALAGLLLATGLVVWCWNTCAQLPVVSATWWWVVLTAALAAIGLWRRTRWLTIGAGIMLAATAAKFLACDTLARRLLGPADADLFVALNWQFALGIVLVAGCLAFARMLVSRFADWDRNAAIRIVAALTAALLGIWAGSFEIDRYFARARLELPMDLGQASQMAHSVWWAIYAAGLLAVGFLARRPSVRYMSLGIFAVTLGKVLLVDMAGIETVYRIFSFLALGVLLVAASLLYQKFFRAALAEWDKARE